jgi:preprotein translocase subunit SecE
MASKNNDNPAQKKNSQDDIDAGSKFQLSQVKQFGNEVKAEFGKIAWPSRKHTIGSTVVVTFFVIIISFYLGAVDMLLGKIVAAVLR